MAFEEDDDKTIYLVLMNCEEQYSLWPKHIAVPNGWKVCKEGNKAECGAYVNEVCGQTCGRSACASTWKSLRRRGSRRHKASQQTQTSSRSKGLALNRQSALRARALSRRAA